jgi:DNA modification methylase
MPNNTMKPGDELDLGHNIETIDDGPVECLGKNFENDQARREYYLELLAEKLKDPEFRKIEGFPIGEDEDILELSDPPYYSACPNPFIEDFINIYGRPYDPDEKYKREPYAADVSEGKNDPIYNAHSYHTKVPHKAIMRYILHYTNPGDLVFDGFSGTGMTGVASQLCGDKNLVESMGFKVNQNGEGKNEVGEVIRVGPRNALVNDLSPIASFIGHNYSNLDGLERFYYQAIKRIDELENELKTLYENDSRKVLNGVWSDAFVCPNCASEVNYWEHAVDSEGKISKEFNCKSCGALVGKASSKSTGAQKLERKFITKFDPILGASALIPKLSLVQEVVKHGAKRINVKADEARQDYVERLSEDLEGNVKEFEFYDGRQTNKLINGSGIKYVHQMYTSRALAVYTRLWQVQLDSHKNTSLFRFCLSGINNYISRKQGYFGGGGGVAGTLFTPSIHLERNVFEVLRRKLKKIVKMSASERSTIVTNQSSSSLSNIPTQSIDYIFVDPPFGESIQYCELNSFVESWLKVRTVPQEDCVLNYVHKKDHEFYMGLMKDTFCEYYRILKPGRWITVEFSNSQSSVWNAIQTALQDSGFIVSNVSSLDKLQHSFNSVTTTTSVKQDLIISAYKPNGGFEKRFINESDLDGMWDFIRTHLNYLPVVKKQGEDLSKIPERDPRILFDQVVAYFVRNVRDVPLSSKEFQEGLLERFAERDGMIFLPGQVSEYDKARISSKQLRQLTIFVDDEESAIEWLRQLLNEKPQTYQDIHPKFINELSGWKKSEEQLELSKLLDQNLIKFDAEGPLPPQIHSYLSTNYKEMRNLSKDDQRLIKKAKDRWYVPNPEREEDLQKLRERDLLKQFNEYKSHTGRKLKTVRMEAVRCGFKKAWQDRDYVTIINIAEKIPQNLLQEDQKLLMWYDQAQTRHSDESLF